MYTSFYGLREKPFSLTPDPRFLYLADSHREALAHLLYGLEQGEGFIVISGEVGTGKTTLCRSLLDRLKVDTEVAILFNPSADADELLESINDEFGLPVNGRVRRQLLASLNQFLLEKKSENKRVVLIVDEAQNLSQATLEQVRLLSNLETASAKLIQIILMGQPELGDKLASPELRQLMQRVTVNWELTSLPIADTAAYIRHRMTVAAEVEREVFSEAALREVHRLTAGIPRLINVLADRSLLAGYAAGQAQIGPKTVRHVARELPGLAWRKTPPARSLRPHFELAAILITVILVVGAAQWFLLRPSAAPMPISVAIAPIVEPDVAMAPPPPTTQSVATVGSWESGPSESILLAWVPTEDAFGLNEPSPPGHGVLYEAPPAAESNDLAEGLYLAALLDDRSAPSSLALAMAAMQDIYAMPALVSDLDSLNGIEDATAVLEASGLAVEPFSQFAFSQLSLLNYPALLELRTETGESRLVGLLTLEKGLADLVGVGSKGRLRVPVRALLQQWTGMAWVVWYPYLDIPQLITEGESGAGVFWVQEALVRLGDPDVQITGEYDATTSQGVERFQIKNLLNRDGVAGPKTQMLLYSFLEEFTPPQLSETEQRTQ